MQVPEHVTKHAVEYVVGAVIMLAVLGGLAFMDVRHITRVDWVMSEIKEKDEDINRLKLYNEFGTEGNKPARKQVILQIEASKEELERELKELQ